MTPPSAKLRVFGYRFSEKLPEIRLDRDFGSNELDAFAAEICRAPCVALCHMGKRTAGDFVKRTDVCSAVREHRLAVLVLSAVPIEVGDRTDPYVCFLPYGVRSDTRNPEVARRFGELVEAIRQLNALPPPRGMERLWGLVDGIEQEQLAGMLGDLYPINQRGPGPDGRVIDPNGRVSFYFGNPSMDYLEFLCKYFHLQGRINCGGMTPWQKRREELSHSRFAEEFRALVKSAAWQAEANRAGSTGAPLSDAGMTPLRNWPELKSEFHYLISEATPESVFGGPELPLDYRDRILRVYEEQIRKMTEGLRDYVTAVDDLVQHAVLLPKDAPPRPLLGMDICGAADALAQQLSTLRDKEIETNPKN
jgi:hypothetical protein